MKAGNRLSGAVRAGTAGAAGVAHGVGVREAARVWAQVALNSFGGPAGQIAVMHRFLVEERRWISEQRFLHALNFCMLLPGPEAQQLATYIGWLMHGTVGGLIAGLLFILPGVVAILALSMLYAAFGDTSVVTGLLFGLQAAVVAVVAEAVLRIGRRALKTTFSTGLAGAAFVAIFFAEVPFPLIVVAAGGIGYVAGHVRPTALRPVDPAGDKAPGVALIGDDGAVIGRQQAHAALKAAAVALVLWLVPVGLLIAVARGSVWAQQATVFSQSAVVTFGGAYAALAFIAQEAVSSYRWLRPGEMLTGLGMAETTPGPLIMVVQFVGFLAAYRNPGGLSPLEAGVLGSLLATWVTFAPCFLFIFAGAPFIERLRGNRLLSTALSAVTAAVVGVVLNLAVWFTLNTAFAEVEATRRFGLRVLVPQPASVDPAAIAIMVVAALALFRFRLSVMRTLAVCTALGLLAVLARGGGL